MEHRRSIKQLCSVKQHGSTKRYWFFAQLAVSLLGACTASTFDPESQVEGASENVAIRIGGPGDPGIPRDAFVNNEAELRRALQNARPGSTVHVKSHIVLSPEGGIRIPSGVTLKGDRNKSVFAEGPSITMTGYPHAAFYIRDANHVRVTGLRIFGPSRSVNEHLENTRGVYIHDSEDVRIDNNEFAGWTESAVHVSNTQRVSYNNVERVRIHDNYFHHNRKQGRGYGVVVRSFGYALIERNLFDSNRHAIAGGNGHRHSGYTAQHNFILEGGDCYYYFPRPSLCTWDQHFDMHGSGTRGRGGDAGEMIRIRYNTFRGAQTNAVGFSPRPAFYLRGKPTIGAYFTDNVLIHSDADDAIKTHGTAVYQRNNQYYVDTSRELAVGDFDGDGYDDVFQATGTSFVYSRAGRREWKFLMASSGRLDHLLLGDFNGNGRTDVLFLAREGWYWSLDGVGAWRRVGPAASIPKRRLLVGDFNGDGKSDVFHADGNRWWVSYGSEDGMGAWEYLNTSRHTERDLRIGDFNGDGRSDVFGLADSQWSVSWGGTTRWRRLNRRLSTALNYMAFADFNRDGRTDIARYYPDDASVHYSLRGQWRISWGGREEFVDFRDRRDMPYEDTVVGDFSGDRRADFLRYDGRSFAMSSAGVGSVYPRSRFPMK